MALGLIPAAELEVAQAAPEACLRVVFSFDIEEHHRIEAAAGLADEPALREVYGERMEDATRWLLDELARTQQVGTFFIVGEIARDRPQLVRAIHAGGHEVASHGWDHRRLHTLSPAEFRVDVQRSKDALEQALGARVHGYRAPTFSLVRQTAWAIDVLADLGFTYDSSIYPVRHDRYGVPGAPRGLFRARGVSHEIIELPPATLRLGRALVPMGGGGYFRVFPSRFLHWSLTQTSQECQPPVAMLYFHPWEFDPRQPRLPLGLLGGLRTYAGVHRSQPRLRDLLTSYRSSRALEVALSLDRATLPSFSLTS